MGKVSLKPFPVVITKLNHCENAVWVRKIDIPKSVRQVFRESS